jgi:hypothetical protein
MHRCRHGNRTTDATRFRHPLQLGPDTTTRSGSTKADSASSTWPSTPTGHPSGSSTLLLSCAAPPPLIMALCSWACREAAVASWARALACQTCASTLSCAARASNSAFLRVAFSTSTSLSRSLRATDSSAAPSSAR